ncbi:restriction endonuclease subunit S [uncultured Dialister sp.]|uniref:restriction endonuclease subunit S n=1 Tax=uncultured Dialister sp. TaxID=278064 RepID=UPI002597231A|nr:restriction endonuclease subunit S [uncultured Dialister sp.]
MLLSDICEIIMGQSPSSDSYNVKGQGLPFFQGNADFGKLYPSVRLWCNCPIKKAEAGDLLVSVRAPIGAVNLANQKCCIGRGLAALRPYRDKCDAMYLYYLIKAGKNKLNWLGTGSTFKAITRSSLLSFNVPDYCIAFQRKISGKLWSVDKLIHQRNEQLKLFDLLIQSRFIEMFGNVGEIDKHKVHDAFVTKLGDVANVKSSHRVFTSEFVESGIPFYRGTEIGELSNGQIPKHPFYITREHYEKLANDDSRPKIGDLLLPSICNNGQIWLVDTNKPFYYKDGRVLCISPYPDVFNSIYLLYYLKYRLTYEYPKLGSGSTFAEFKIFQLKNMDVLVPNIMKQNLFANFIHQVDKSKYREAIFLYLLEDIRICCNI